MTDVQIVQIVGGQEGYALTDDGHTEVVMYGRDEDGKVYRFVSEYPGDEEAGWRPVPMRVLGA